MPLLQLQLNCAALDATQRSALSVGLTERMALLLGKRADLTVVQIEQSPAQDWFCGGQPLDAAGWCASLTVHITAGTNTAAQQADFIASAHALLQDVLAQPAVAPVYILFHALDAQAWGYDGRTQHSRRPTPSAASCA